MAGDWIPWTKGLSRRREVLYIAEQTGLSRREVACLLMEFWEWADSESEDGFFPALSVRSLSALHADVPRGFFESMQEIGWISLGAVEGGGYVQIPNFDRWMGKSAKRRLREAQRKATNRNKRRCDAPFRRKVSASDADADADRKRPTEQNSIILSNGAENCPEKEGVAQPSARKNVRARDLLFDALAEVTGSDPKVSGSYIGKVKSLLLAADPPYTPEEVRRLPGVLRDRGWSANIAVTLNVVEKYIGWVRQAPPVPATESLEDRSARVRREREAIAELRRRVQAEQNPPPPEKS